jgi:hypothetical protein
MSLIARAETSAIASETGRKCSKCGGRLCVLMRIDRGVSGAPVIYYSCDHCAQALIQET